MNKKSLLTIIYENKLSLAENPFGVDMLWPKSYGKLYYQKKMGEIYKRNNSPNLLEINQQSYLRNKIWENFYKKPVIKTLEINSKNNFQDYRNNLSNFDYDIIIINNSSEINNLNFLIKKFKKILKNDGLIIIENINSNILMVTKIILCHQCKIFDFRLNKFIRNNCLIEIKKSNIFFMIIFFPLNYVRFIFYIFNSFIYLLILMLTKILKRLNF